MTKQFVLALTIFQIETYILKSITFSKFQNDFNFRTLFLYAKKIRKKLKSGYKITGPDMKNFVTHENQRIRKLNFRVVRGNFVFNTLHHP